MKQLDSCAMRICSQWLCWSESIDRFLNRLTCNHSAICLLAIFVIFICLICFLRFCLDQLIVLCSIHKRDEWPIKCWFRMICFCFSQVKSSLKLEINSMEFGAIVVNRKGFSRGKYLERARVTYGPDTWHKQNRKSNATTTTHTRQRQRQKLPSSRNYKNIHNNQKII